MQKFSFLCVAVLFIFISACTEEPSSLTPDPAVLIPYETLTLTPRPSTPEGLAPFTTPPASATPFTYIVKSGDTISSIALTYGVSMDDLIAANPQVSPNVMSIGTILKIPSDPKNPSGEPTPTPVQLIVEDIECYPTINKGMGCFVLVRNDLLDLIENVSAQVTLLDESGSVLASQTAYLPLNILTSNSSLPMYTYFLPEIPFSAKPQVQILTAVQTSQNDQRYLAASTNNTLIEIGSDGHYAEISGVVALLDNSKAASLVWVAATGYDAYERVVAVRRWEGGGIQPGASLPFEMSLSSLGGRMTRVDFVVEARP